MAVCISVWPGGLKPLLAAKSKLPVNHHAAQGRHGAPRLMAARADDPSMGAMALRFLIMTA